ncbi:MAG: RNA polymerase sigma factor [Flavobacteriaceae bacterium]
MQLILKESFLNDLPPLKNKLFRIAKRLLVSKEEAEDATQEILTKLWQMDAHNRAKFKNLEAYGDTMIKNYCLDRLKSKQVQGRANQEVPQLSSGNSLARTLDFADATQWVSKIINKLPEKERIIVQLRDIEQYSFKEIESVVDLPEATIRVYLSRARKKIRTAFLKIDNYGL